MEIVIGEFLAGDPAHHRGGVEDGVPGHFPGRFVEAYGAFAFFVGREGHRLDFNDGAKVTGDAEAEDMAHFRLVGGLFGDVLIEAAHLRHFIDVGFFDGDGATFAALAL